MKLMQTKLEISFQSSAKLRWRRNSVVWLTISAVATRVGMWLLRSKRRGLRFEIQVLWEHGLVEGRMTGSEGASGAESGSR